jgi:hypothetical protein
VTCGEIWWQTATLRQYSINGNFRNPWQRQIWMLEEQDSRRLQITIDDENRDLRSPFEEDGRSTMPPCPCPRDCSELVPLLRPTRSPAGKQSPRFSESASSGALRCFCSGRLMLALARGSRGPLAAHVP